jgi:hypothetical protein
MNATSVRTLGVVGVTLLAAMSPAAAMAHPDSGASWSPPAKSALLQRSEALNQQLGLGATINADLRSPDTRDAATAARSASESALGVRASDASFDWSAAGIGAVTVVLAGSLALTAGAVIRRKPQGLWG